MTNEQVFRAFRETMRQLRVGKVAHEIVTEDGGKPQPPVLVITYQVRGENAEPWVQLGMVLGAAIHILPAIEPPPVGGLAILGYDRKGRLVFRSLLPADAVAAYIAKEIADQELLGQAQTERLF